MNAMQSQTDVVPKVVAVVGPAMNMVKRTEVNLEMYCQHVLVLGFADAESFFLALDAERWPELIVIADTAAHRPSAEKGLFSKICQLAPEAKRILFTANSDGVDAADIRRLGLCEEIVDRRGPHRWAQLAEAVRGPTHSGHLAPVMTRLRRLRKVMPRRAQRVVIHAATDLPALGDTLSWVLLRSVCQGMLLLAALAVALGVFAQAFWQLLLPGTFGVLVFGLVISVIRRIERGVV